MSALPVTSPAAVASTDPVTRAGPRVQQISHSLHTSVVPRDINVRSQGVGRAQGRGPLWSCDPTSNGVATRVEGIAARGYILAPLGRLRMTAGLRRATMGE